MSNFQQQGTIRRVFEIERRAETFTTRDFVIELAGQYPQFIKFQLVQDRVGAIDAFEEGQEVIVHFDLRGREWQGKFFTNLQAWKIDKAGDGVDDSTTTQTHAPAKPEAAPMDWSLPAEPNVAQAAVNNEDDSLPF